MSPIKILVVDDDRAALHLTSALLRNEGYEVATALNGPTAIETLQRDGSFQLAVLDYQMPGMDGVELFDRLRQLQPDIQGVFLTAYATINTVFPAIGVGVERVLAKPVDRNELLPIVEDLVGRP